MNKQRRGWILCPSKNYPGRFYYFNIHNGEAVWSLNGVENIRDQSHPESRPQPDNASPSMLDNHIPIYSPIFGQTIFPKYISDVDDMTIIWTPIYKCNLANRQKKMLDANIQTDIKMSKWCEKPNSNHTKLSSLLSNIGFHSNIIPKRKLDLRPCLKESKLRTQESDNSNNENYIHSNDLQDATYNIGNIQNKTIENNTYLDSNDLRFVLRAKKEIMTTQTETTTHTNVRPKSDWYVVVDKDVLLEDFDFIISYVNKDESCKLYIPKIIQEQLKSLAYGAHNGRSSVIVARQLQQRLDNYKSKLNLPDSMEGSAFSQIINCCLEITKRRKHLMLIAKDALLLRTAQSHKINAFSINDIKSSEFMKNNVNVLFENRRNVFLHSLNDFDPLNTQHKNKNFTKLYSNEDNNTSSIRNDRSVSRLNKYCSHDISKINFDSNNFKTTQSLNMGMVKNNLFNEVSPNTSDETIKSLFRRNNDSVTDLGIVNQHLMNGKVRGNESNIINFTNNHLNTINTKNISVNNIIEIKLEPFRVRDVVMEKNLYLRLEEWVCSFEQIFEDFLDISLQQNPQRVSQPPVWCIKEGLECLKEIYKENKYITCLVEKILVFYNFSGGRGKYIKPYNFMTLIGYGFCLVEALECTLDIEDVRDNLNYLIDNISQPIQDLIADTPIPRCTDDTQTYKCNYNKSQSDIVQYLKNHFPEWKNYNEVIDQPDQNIRVLRTCGKYLNTLTIDRSKQLQITKCDNKRKEAPKVLKNVKLNIHQEKKSNIGSISNTFYSTYNEGYEARSNDKVTRNNDSQINDCLENNSSIINDDCFVSTAVLSYTLVQNFFSELSFYFKTIHDFIHESVKDYDNISEKQKNDLQNTAKRTHTHIIDVIEKLKNIKQRESGEKSVLKSLLIESGSRDRRIIRYRPVILKCVEQATILEHSLRVMLAAIDNEEISVSEENIQFINIYE